MVGAVAAALGEPPLEEVQKAAVELLGGKLAADDLRGAVEEGYRWVAWRTWNELPVGGTVVPDAAQRPLTGGWRTGLKPEVDSSLCVNCLLCWLYCPDSAVQLDGTTFTGFDLDYCQGLRDLRRGVPGRRGDDGSRGGRAVIETRPRLMTGGEAVAYAMQQIDPDVVPVYPITPQTPIIQGFAKHVADGEAHAELVNVESEHSAMSAAVGAALAGARTMTATSSQGLALMAEVVYIAAAMRAPIVMAVGNRALSGPINIHCDHSDSMLIRTRASPSSSPRTRRRPTT